MQADVLRVQRLAKHFRVGSEIVRAVDDVSFDVAAGEFVALYGPSGSGKSTLLDLLAGFQTPDTGRVVVQDKDVHAFTEREHADYLRLTVGIIGQPGELLPAATARENACLKLLREHAGAAPRVIESLLVELGLGERLNQPTRKLSMGERQRVMIAQALSTDPPLVLADEPTGSLDTRRSRETLALIRKYCDERETATLVATHDPEAVQFATRAYELRDGHLREYMMDDVRYKLGAEKEIVP